MPGRPAMSPRRNCILRSARARRQSIRQNTSAAPDFLDRDAEPSRQILDELPGDTARARAARRRPFERVVMQALVLRRNLVMLHIGIDHRQIFVLAAAMKSEPQAETVG